MREFSATIFLALAMTIAWAPPVSAAGELYAVVGVMADDVLYIRARPKVGAAILGAIPPTGQVVEATGKSSGSGRSLWREVRYGAVTGWVNARFLAAPAAARPPELPATLRCGGTEPFFSIYLEGKEAAYNTPDGKTLAYEVTARDPADNRSDIWGVRLSETGTGLPANLVLRHTGMCSDGMSDLRYPWFFIFLRTDAPPRSGCCGKPVKPR